MRRLGIPGVQVGGGDPGKDGLEAQLLYCLTVGVPPRHVESFQLVMIMHDLGCCWCKSCQEPWPFALFAIVCVPLPCLPILYYTIPHIPQSLPPPISESARLHTSLPIPQALGH